MFTAVARCEHDSLHEETTGSDLAGVLHHRDHRLAEPRGAFRDPNAGVLRRVARQLLLVVAAARRRGRGGDGRGRRVDAQLRAVKRPAAPGRMVASLSCRRHRVGLSVFCI